MRHFWLTVLYYVELPAALLVWLIYGETHNSD